MARHPEALEGLVKQWMRLPGYEEKMRRFFITEFQQDHFSFDDLTYQFCSRTPFSSNKAQFLQNLQESFGRTAMQLIAEGAPFTSVMTTTRFMMTPALMATYAFQDSMQVDDLYICNPAKLPARLTIQSRRPIPIQRAIDPRGPDYMTFFAPGLTQDVVFAADESVTSLAAFLLEKQPAPQHAANEPAPGVSQGEGYMDDADFNTWRMVTIRPPAAGEATTPLYDLPAMRAGRDLVLNVPRASFFTTPAFAARWPTNDDNQHRVTINQTLIVALGRPVDLANKTGVEHLAAADEVHAPEGGECFECHRSLDPMRQIFQQQYTRYFSRQNHPVTSTTFGEFVFRGVRKSPARFTELGAMLASHPLFAPAWVQKLCTYATSMRCDEEDPEFKRLVGIFVKSGYQWNALVVSLFASPLVTYLSETRTAAGGGQVFPLAREEHLCATLSARLGLADACGMETPLFVANVPLPPTGGTGIPLPPPGA